MALENFRVITLNHQKAPVSVREHFSFVESEIPDFLSQIAVSLEITEVLLLTTCNRTELYYVAPKSLFAEILGYLFTWKGIENGIVFQDYFEEIPGGNSSVQYLFEVGVGLHSSILGDLQIGGQLKQAYQFASDSKTAGSFIHRLLHTFFHIGKRVQQETSWRDGVASVSYASVVLIEECLAHITHPNILVIGCGEMGIDAAKSIISREIGKLTIANRTLSKAQNISQELGCQIATIEEALLNLSHYDGIIVAVNTPEPILNLRHFTSQNLSNGLVVIDLGVPRSVNAEIEVVPQVLLYNLDEIQTKVDTAVKKRIAAIPMVQGILTEELAKIKTWEQELVISPVIHRLKETFETFRSEELSRFGKNQPAEVQQLLDAFSKSLIQKLLKHPVVHLKSACMRGEQEQLMDAIRRLFDISESSEITLNR
ncbi:MAG: glutamyl-tRNA reductase [Bacteroidia bacterium]|nr:glutamyl-tRNA reductase [Bacteroidia bacterium]